MPNFFRYILPFLILLTSLKGEAQVYPVQSTLQFTPPYSLTLADYVAPGSEKVVLNIFLADVNRPELSVRLRLRIEGVGIRIETKAEYLPEPMMISGGVPLRLIGADLVDYFDPRNLNFSGITQREYEQKAALPEGLYQFTFEVIEYNRGVKISNSATVMAWLILNDPPLINLPKDNDKIRIQSPQQVIFQWTPRHTGSPNAAFSTEYEFRLVEVWPSIRNPNDAILTSPAIFETTTAASTLIYGPAETSLEPGRRYAFRIKAKSIVGVDELNLFKNNGYSQVSTFVYGDACTLPTGIQAEVISSSKIGFAWDTEDNHTGYNIKYRLANTPNAAWYTNTSALNDIEINSLQPATTYEYQVAAACGSYESEYSPVATVTTNEAQAITYSCGLPLNPFDLDPSQLIESLKTGDVIQAGDFDVKLTEVSGSNGIFTGKGVIEVPFFNKARLQASFSSISVNKELRMVAGSMNITGGGVEVIPAGVMDLMDELTEALALADSALNLVESNLPQPFDPYSFVADKEVKMTGTITSVTKGASGGVVVTSSNGTQQTIPAGGTTAIADSNGNGYLIDSKGNIHPTTVAIASAAAHREYNLNVNFAKASDMRFGFDAKKYDALINTYEQVKDTYYAPWKSVATGQTDNVLALLEGTTVDKTKIHFEQSGVGLGTSDLGNISQSPSPNSQVLTIKGTTDGMQESVVALYTPSDTTKKEQVLGKLNVVTYNQIDKHVVIVPVNGNTFDKFGSVAILQDSLNKIYNQGIVNWTVELKPGITVEGISPFEDGGTGLLSNFTSHMKKVINAYKENTTPDTYYLFLVSNPQDPSTLGVMPRSKEYGFIFADKHSTLPEVARTIAHELGHGAFNLHHTFMEPNYTITKGTTDNLMDYPAGPKLYKYQWDKIRYPDIVVGIFESDEEAALTDDGEEMSVEEISAFKTKFKEATGQDLDKLQCGFWDIVGRYHQVKKRYDDEGIAFYAAYIRFVLCATSEEACGKKSPLSAFTCGFTNGIVQQIDWVSFLDLILDVEINKEKVKEIFECVKSEFPIGGSYEDNPDLQKVLIKCITGIDVDAIDISKFVSEIWTDPYSQGQATAFIITLVGPFKQAILSKLKNVSKFAKVKLFSGVSKVDDIINISNRIANLTEDAGSYVKAFGASNDLNKLKSWLGQVKDGKLYVAVHGEGTTFSVLHNNEVHSLSHRSLAKWIETNPEIVGNKDIVLLTCANGLAAQNLANKISTGNKIISWEGVTKVNKNGVIIGEGKCYTYSKSTTNGFNRAEIATANLPRGNLTGKIGGEEIILGGIAGVDEVGKYTTKIRWGIQDIEVRPYEKGYWGKRVSQSDPQVDAFELKINPNNESFYLPYPEGGFVQYENIVNMTVQDGKLIMDQSSIYHVLDKPEFLTTKSVLEPAQRQFLAAKAAGYKVEWLVSDEKAVLQLTQYFKEKNIDITVTLLRE